MDERAPRPWYLRLLTGLGVLDWIAIGLLVAGVLCVATGLLPYAGADATVRRILPLLLFLGTVIVLAELTADAEVFDVIAARVAITARGSYLLLFLLCVAFASLNTITLNLDTTAVLLTPVMLALARKLDVPAMPLAITTVWLANTASLLLPVSNLTNLLAANRVGLRPVAFAQRMWLPQLAAIAVTMVFLWLFYWRRGQRGAERYRPPAPHRPRDRVLYLVAFVACGLFIAAILAGLPLQVASAGSAGIVLAGYLLRARTRLAWRLLPWRLLVFVTGLFLVMQTIGRHGLDTVVRGLIGTAGGTAGTFRAGATGVLLSNVLNNLPAYVAGEAVVPLANHVPLLGLLIGTNVGPLATPWASLATLIWYERCRAAGVPVPLRKFVLTGAGLAVAGTAATIGALLVT
ncbi:MAG TPA: SLC13 family permease [Rugosimonospora sp.]|nr:SLC13 family permease [Rugosimonospora sp.]